MKAYIHLKEERKVNGFSVYECFVTYELHIKKCNITKDVKDKNYTGKELQMPYKVMFNSRWYRAYCRITPMQAKVYIKAKGINNTLDIYGI